MCAVRLAIRSILLVCITWCWKLTFSQSYVMCKQKQLQKVALFTVLYHSIQMKIMWFFFMQRQLQEKSPSSLPNRLLSFSSFNTEISKLALGREFKCCDVTGWGESFGSFQRIQGAEKQSVGETLNIEASIRHTKLIMTKAESDIPLPSKPSPPQPFPFH